MTMFRTFTLVFLTSLAACDLLPVKDDTATDDTAAACGDPVEKPHDTSKPEWSYHGEDDGPDQWGSLTGYETCGTGTQQTPIDIIDADAIGTDALLSFEGYDVEIPLDLLNNGHTLQVNYTGTQSAADPQVSYAGEAWYLVQFHGHATSEHTLDGASFPLELHFVHQNAAGAYLVVGLLLDAGAENETVATMLERDPGHHLEVSCDDAVSLAELVPTTSGYYHYDGSLTTPGCTEGVAWFVLRDRGAVAAEQAEEWQTEFGGTTNRPIQPLNGRVVETYTP